MIARLEMEVNGFRVAGQLDGPFWMPVESRRTNGRAKTAPQLVLHLFQHMLGRDDQRSFRPAPADQLRQDHIPISRGLAQPDRIGDQDSGSNMLRIKSLATAAC